MVILPVHIVIALTSVLYSTILYMSPSKTKLNITYGLVVLTLITGTDLVIVSHAQMLSSCTTGLIYIAAMFVAIFASQRKMAAQKSRQDMDK